MSQPEQSKRFLRSCFLVLSLGYSKTLNDWSRGKQSVLLPLDLNVTVGFVSGNSEDLGETKLTVSYGTSHYVL